MPARRLRVDGGPSNSGGTGGRPSGDLTSYAAMLGDSFASQIDWLAQLLGTAHAPSLGAYKERLLRRVISTFLPRRYEVGTGFVLFPSEKLIRRGDRARAGSDRSHEISRQCDLLVFDATEHPVLYREDDFVVLRPEAVRAVIEVKGTLDLRGVNSTLDSFLDYARKWKACREFYRRNDLTKLRAPELFLMAWAPARGTRGQPQIDGRRLRARVVAFYRRVPRRELPGLPLLNAVYLYNDFVVSAMHWVHDDHTHSFGYSTMRGKLVRYRGAEPELAGDGTIAALLAAIQVSLETPFNPSISYVDQTNRIDVLPHRHEGYELWLRDDDCDLIAPKHLQD